VLEQEEFPAEPDPQRALQRIISSVRYFSERHKASIEAVGVTIPGLVDPETGHAVYVPYFEWRDLPIEQEIAVATGLPVTIDNDANSVALAELWFGRPELSDARDFIVVLVGAGVGTGIIIDGQVYRGERGAAGEFGHMIVGARAPVPCSCGNYDCWEAFASERAALARYAGSRRVDAHAHPPTFSMVIDRALAGEAGALNALIETATYLGIGISNLVVGFSPEVVVVGGEIARAWSLIEEALTKTIHRSVRRGLPTARIVPSTLGPEPGLMGALSLVLANKFGASFAA